MPADPNTLITTIISTTSSIVSITGGFLVSRLISLSAEKNGILAKISDLQKEIDSLQSSIDEIELRNLESDREYFFDEAYKKIIEYDTSLEELVEDDEANINDRTIEELRPIFNLIHKILADLNTGVESLTELPNDFSDFVNKTNLVYDKKFEYEYSKIFNFMIETVNRQSSFWNIKYSPATYIRSGKTRDEIEDELDALITQRNLKEKLIESTKDSLERIGRPEGIVSGLWFIIVSSILGIMFPVTLLPMENENFTVEIKVLLIFFFLVILTYFATYLYVLVQRLYPSKK